jgi:hypothetical protein
MARWGPVPAGNRTPHAPRAVECEKAAPRARERWSMSVRTSTHETFAYFFGRIKHGNPLVGGVG